MVVSVVEGFELFVDDLDELQLMITVVATAVKITNMRFIGFYFLLLNKINGRKIVHLPSILFNNKK